MKLFVNCNLRRVGALAAALAACAYPLPAFAQAVSPIDYGPNSVADARLGVALATLGELADAPELLARPSSQSFVDDTFARVATTNDTLLRTHADHWRDALRVGSGPTFDRANAYASVADLAKETLRAVGPGRANFVSFGIIAEQAAYNARVLHDALSDKADRTSIGADGVADPLVPGLKDLRAQLAGLDGKSWDRTAGAAEQIVAALLGSEFDTPFQRSSAVWLVLLRTRTTSADARRHAAHYFIDVVHYDGTRQTIGAYPNGTLAFDRDAPHLVCALDRELDAPVARSVPVSPGLGSSSAELAKALVHSCTDSQTEGLRYHVASADDDRLIADLLFRNGVSVGPVLRAAAGR